MDLIFWGTKKREIMVTLLPVKVQWKDIEHKYTFDLELNSGQTHTQLSSQSFDQGTYGRH